MHISQQRFALLHLHPSGRLCLTDTAIARPLIRSAYTAGRQMMTYSATADDLADRHPVVLPTLYEIPWPAGRPFSGRCGGQCEIFLLRALSTCAINKLRIE
jgi:hypothetical protein